MTISRRNLMAATMLAPIAAPVFAQTYPSRVVRLVVPYPAGSALDVVGRLFAELFTPRFGQPSIVVNQPGGSAAIGTRAVAAAAPDGYTLLLGTNQTHGANSALYSNLGYDALNDFVPIAGIGRLQHVLVIRQGLGVNSVRELVALSRKSGMRLNYGSSGIGSASHLAAEMFKLATGAVAEHVPYNGSGPAAQALRGGHIDFAVSTLPSVLAFIQAGAMVPLGVASPTRAPQLPELSTLAEQGFPKVEADAWAALFAPARTPTSAVKVLSDFVLDAFAKPEVTARLDTSGFVPQLRDQQAFRSFLERDMQRWANVIRAADVKL